MKGTGCDDDAISCETDAGTKAEAKDAQKTKQIQQSRPSLERGHPSDHCLRYHPSKAVRLDAVLPLSENRRSSSGPGVVEPSSSTSQAGRASS